ncbi:MAG TPA: PQQ-dependent sugar dehydrogenase [Anaerovoracaceae bacterium]|nr:PQQ-dependent sugar dehydrogenase [Anaerovoracaceae bacterium]
MDNQEHMADMTTKRYLNPKDIMLPPGFMIEVFAEGLTTPINITFTKDKEMLVADSGITDGNGKVMKRTNNGFEIVADGFNAPLTGITVHNGDIYVSHRRFVTVVKPDGKKVDILDGLPSDGDHHNNRVVFGPDGKMYYGQGTATNSGVPGKDNDWIPEHPFFHDYPGATITLNGENFGSSTFLEHFPDRKTVTGAYSPFGVPSSSGQMVKGITRANGSIMRANADGTNLELVAWGLRNPFRIRFDRNGRLYAANHGLDIRGSRPVANSPDEFQLIEEGIWYGWPDYTGGQPVTDPQFKPEGMKQPEFLLSEHPMIPPKPFAEFRPHSATMGFSFNEDPGFGPVGEAYIAEFGAIIPTNTGGKPIYGVGHRVSRINMDDGTINLFAINNTGVPAHLTGGGGFERPIDAVFGPDGALYISDFGIFTSTGPVAKTGVIWKVTRSG